jgi:hypothetical protein
MSPKDQRQRGTFPKGFRPIVELRNVDDECRLKRHFRGVLREVVGYLDLLADNNEQRFVEARVPDIVAHCNNFPRGKKRYNERWVKYGLAYLRAHGVLIPAVAEVNGTDRFGYRVVHHDEMTLPHKKSPGSNFHNLCVAAGCASRTLAAWVALPTQKYPADRQK